jgi:hypothetical protein
MRRFFIVLFILSLIATAATLYWRTYLPEEIAVASAPAPKKSESPDAGDRSIQQGGPEARSYIQEAAKEPSERQDYAVTISIISSIISAVAAMLQTWLTARAYRR